MAKILAGILIGTLGVLIPFSAHLPLPGTQAAYAQSASKPATRSPVTLSGGPGDKPENAVVISGAAHSMEGISAEYKYLERKFGPRNQFWKLKRQSVMKQNGRIYDRLELELKGGRKQTVFFDISEFFGKL